MIVHVITFVISVGKLIILNGSYIVMQHKYNNYCDNGSEGLPGYDAPTSLAKLAAITFSLLISTALTSFFHVASESLASQWTISACKRSSTFGSLALMVEVAVARLNPVARSFHL